MGGPYRPKEGWGAYFDAVAGGPPRETLLDALERFEREGRHGGGAPLVAADVGCGAGRDTFELLRRGWRVLALDSEPEAIRRLETGVAAPDRDRVRTLLASYEDVTLGPVDLVNASYSIPHCSEGVFDAMWARLTGAIRTGGRFAGQLFGVRDGWNAAGPELGPGWRGGRQFHTREQAEALLARAGLVPEMIREAEEDGRTALGEPKHWHIFHIVARKR